MEGELDLKQDYLYQIVGVISYQDFYQENGVWDFRSSVKEHLEDCDVVEFRGDTFPSILMIEALKAFSKKFKDLCLNHIKILFTIRLKEDGGEWLIEYSRREYFEKALPLVDWVDIELEEIDLYLKLSEKIKENKIIYVCSHHQFNRDYSTEEYQNLYQRMQKYSPNVTKIVVFCRDERELLLLLNFVEAIAFQNLTCQSLTCLMSMGDFGKVSRIVSPLLGAKLTYGFLGEKPLVLGQVPVSELKETIRFYLKSSKKRTVQDWVDTVA